MKVSSNKTRGLLALAVSIVCCAASQLLLKSGMSAIGTLPALNNLPAYAVSLITPPIIGGLMLYAFGTALWLICLTKLDLSVAYPASAVQFLLIFAGAWYFFGEPVTNPRLAGAAVVIAGVLLLTLDRKPSTPSPTTLN
ncbi:MAG: 4-amino-4-deoxy-L-arabinose transferase [Verrucomicrobia bacterium]|nr:4-amino-4-deoxy-L-arabinose transferase [Verrucomicrobiota bacterium]